MESGFVVVIVIDHGCTFALCVPFVYCCTVKAHFGVELGITFVGWCSRVEAEGCVVADEEGYSVHDITIVL